MKQWPSLSSSNHAVQEDQCTINAMLAVLYFCSFMLVCTYILLQLLVGIILESILAATTMENLAVKEVSRTGSPAAVSAGSSMPPLKSPLLCSGLCGSRVCEPRAWQGVLGALSLFVRFWCFESWGTTPQRHTTTWPRMWLAACSGAGSRHSGIRMRAVAVTCDAAIWAQIAKRAPKNPNVGKGILPRRLDTGRDALGNVMMLVSLNFIYSSLNIHIAHHTMQDDLQAFVRAWELLDPFGTSYIKAQELSRLLALVRCGRSLNEDNQ